MKSMKRKIQIVGLILGFAALGFYSWTPAAAAHEDRQDRLTVEVAIDARTFVYDQGVDPNTPFLRGDTFLIYGKIFPAGTLPSGAASNDPNAPGSIGTWICRGTFILDQRLDDGTKPHVITTQTFMFDNGSGLSSDGLEGNIKVLRTIIGGTGRFSGAAGQVTEQPLGTNVTGTENARFVFQFKD